MGKSKSTTGSKLVPHKEIVFTKPSIQIRQGNRNKRSENALRKKLREMVDENNKKKYSEEQIEYIINIRNSEFVIKRDNGEEIIIKRHGYLKNEQKGQSHHLNQDASFKSVIPTLEGMAITLEGDVFTEEESAHYKAHEAMEAFWADYRKDGKYARENPTIKDYNQALKISMYNAGFTEDEAKAIVEIAACQQEAYGFHENDKVIRVPNKIYPVKTENDSNGG